ncbi:tetratricopeptide repeat protein [Panacibacter ginsenosidivorans]|uniref:Tetratricopeptide repeat protein n=1 Tax=Panacibacter ginsenosidivorans TaxID=1813871 RepID=A0A5B8V6I9_9BACT|nr:tetratricopeptide repeat protein [Panacibacter ginsenosidivorans]QEC67080.1 tetratricopeptide repeat protein [Panacibacter ginsenosidivorans]
MKKQQLILISGGLVLLVLLYFFGNTTPPASASPQMQSEQGQSATNNNSVSTDVLAIARKSLAPAQSEKLTQLENSVVRGDVKDQKILVYNQIAHYWRDTLHRPDIGAYYMGEAAKLENSEKNLNFAARLMLNQIMAGSEPDKTSWLALNAKALYEQVLKINPANDSAKIELGACYLFGNISAMPMEGIQKIREVADRDTTNMYAQLMLGLGDIRSQQYDKAVERLEKVVQKEPNNLQALFNLAETYERKGDKENAIKWYREVEGHIDVPAAKQEIENRINSLK